MLLQGATLLHLDPPRVERADLRVEGGDIVEVGAHLRLRADEELIPLAGKWILPGLVCGHHHLYSALACGMPMLAEAPTSFADMLAKLWWRLDRALDANSVAISAKVGALAALKAGVTTIIDHHASPSFIEGSLEVLDEAIGSVGQRRILCYEVSERGGLVEARAGLDAHRPLLAEGPSAERALLVGVHASFTVSDDTLAACAALARAHDTGIHMHLGEAVDDVRLTKDPLVARLERLGALLPKSLFAHCVHVSEGELARIEAAGAVVSHQPRSNMNNGVGYAPVAAFGDNTLLGTDGIDGDMLAELACAYFRAQEAQVDAGPARFVQMLARGASYASELLRARIGQLAPGHAADLVVLDACPGPPLRTENLAAALVFRLASREVRSVLIGGRWRLWNRAPTSLDEDKLAADAERAAEAVWARMR